MKGFSGAALLVSILTLAAPGLAQQPPAPGKSGEESLELRHGEKERPVVKPAPQSEGAVGEAQKAVEELERKQREQRLLRESKPQPSRRPDLEESVTGGIQTRELQKERPAR